MKKYLTKYEFRWAAIITILSLLWTAFEYEMGWHGQEIDDHRYFTFIFILILTLGYFLFFLDKRGNRYKKRFKIKHAFYSGLGLTFLIALFSIPTQYLVHKLVSPDYIETAQNYAVDSGEFTRAEARSIFRIRNFMVFFPVVYMLYGIVMSVFFALFLQRSSSRKKR